MKDYLLQIKSKINKKVYLDGSKSISNRSLIIAAVAEGETKFENLANSNDVLACITALKKLGCKINHSKQNKSLSIIGCNGKFENHKAKIFCDESGTLTRFIIPMCAVQASGTYHIHAKQRMTDRPLADQLKPLEEIGMKAWYDNKSYAMPLTIYAEYLRGGNLKVDGKKSSQFASGLLMAAPFMQEGLSLTSITDHKQPYLQMTAKIMSEFGINVDVNQNTYTVKKSKYSSIKNYMVEPDISTASYFWAFAAITGSTIKVINVTKNSKQGDIKFLDVLEKIGCKVKYFDNAIQVTGTEQIKGITINMRNFSDTFMTLAVIACFAKQDTYISGLSHTRAQESDRVSAIATELTKLGISVKTTYDSILISPAHSKFKPTIVESHKDHRIAMSLALFGLKYKDVVINNAQAVNKTCPDYFAKMRALAN